MPPLDEMIRPEPDPPRAVGAHERQCALRHNRGVPYLGPSLRIDVRMVSGDLIVAEGARPLAADFSLGDDVRVGWDPNDLSVLG